MVSARSVLSLFGFVLVTSVVGCAGEIASTEVDVQPVDAPVAVHGMGPVTPKTLVPATPAVMFELTPNKLAEHVLDPGLYENP